MAVVVIFNKETQKIPKGHSSHSNKRKEKEKNICTKKKDLSTQKPLKTYGDFECTGSVTRTCVNVKFNVESTSLIVIG